MNDIHTRERRSQPVLRRYDVPLASHDLHRGAQLPPQLPAQQEKVKQETPLCSGSQAARDFENKIEVVYPFKTKSNFTIHFMVWQH